MNLLENTDQKDLQIDPNVDPYEVLTGPGGKYDRSKYNSDEDMHRAMARGKYEGDMYIEHRNRTQDELRNEYLKLRDEYNAGQSLKELIDQLKSNKESQNDITQNVPEDKSESFDWAKVDEYVSTKLQTAKQQEKEEANFNAVQSKLKEVYGDNYANTLKQQISELGLTVDFVNDLARKHPEVLYRTLGLNGNQKETFQAPPASRNRSDPFAPNVNKRTWSYYEKMRKTEPYKYFDPKTQNQMFKDATALGAAFNDGDFQERLIQY
jgi:hypothetical protein